MSITKLIQDTIGWTEGEASAQRTVDLLWALARFTLPEISVEAGTHEGHTALALAAALETSGSPGHIWTADPVESKVMENAEKLGLKHRITYFRGDFLEMTANLPGPINFAYLDAGPDHDGMRWRHFLGMWNQLAPGALVATDDVAGCWPHVEDFQKLGFYFPQHLGLSLWQKPL